MPVEAFWFPAAIPAGDPGVTMRQTGDWLIVKAERFAPFVAIDLPDWLPADNYFHLAPGQQRTIALRAR